MSRLHQTSSNLLPLTFAGLLLYGGSEALRALADTSLLMIQISLELCQMGIAVLRVCGI